MHTNTYYILVGRDGEAVFVQGARGKPPTNTHKVCATYADGYRLTAVCVIGGPKAAAKGHKTIEAILNRFYSLFQAPYHH